jgi:hypothetical protein
MTAAGSMPAAVIFAHLVRCCLLFLKTTGKTTTNLAREMQLWRVKKHVKTEV